MGGLKKITEPCRVGPCISSTTKLEACIPVRGRFKVLSVLPVTAEFVVGCSFFRIFKHLICLADFFEFFFGFRRLVDIRMEFSRTFPVCLLDLLLSSIARDVQYLIVIFVFHRLSYLNLEKISVNNTLRAP